MATLPTLPARQRRAVVAEDLHVVAGHRLGRRAGLHGQHPEAHAVGRDGPAGLGLPPVVDHRDPQERLGPKAGVRVQRSPARNRHAEPREVVLAHHPPSRVLPLDGSKCGGRGEEDADPVLLDDPPELARIRRAHRLAFVDDRRAAVQQRRRRRCTSGRRPSPRSEAAQKTSPGADAVDVVHDPREGHRVAAVVANDALGLPRRARRVEDVERVGGGARGRSPRAARRP